VSETVRLCMRACMQALFQSSTAEVCAALPRRGPGSPGLGPSGAAAPPGPGASSAADLPGPLDLPVWGPKVPPGVSKGLKHPGSKVWVWRAKAPNGKSGMWSVNNQGGCDGARFLAVAFVLRNGGEAVCTTLCVRIGGVCMSLCL
jgi:hypothetical protein